MSPNEQVLAGLLVLNKPVGISSRAALDKVAGLLPGVKVGHAGTLDPAAAGVLIACVGRATRLTRYVQQMAKQYRAMLQLGVESETGDLEGQLRRVTADEVSRERFEQCLSGFRGEVQQVPPAHSAVHVRGRRAYELARRGRPVQLTPRTVRIDQLDCLRFDFPVAELQVCCGAGTYVRSLVHDLGRRLGCGAVMTALVRTAIGPFRIEQAVAPEELTSQSLPQHLLPSRAAVSELPNVTVSADSVRRLAHGRPVACPPSMGSASGEAAVCDRQGQLVAVAVISQDSRQLVPKIVLANAAAYS